MSKKIIFILIGIIMISSCLFSQTKTIKIDMEKVRETWLSWYNGVREEMELPPYKYNSLLDKTALEWSQIALKRDRIVHKRDLSDDLFYNYKEIKKWFLDRGLDFTNIKGYTFTENIGYGYYVCGDYDCTEKLIKSIRSTFNFFMAEKNLKERWQRAHYESIVNKYFREIGLGIIIDEDNKGYYLTVHYATEVIEIQKDKQ
jgi:uncharacterized protein YkwD